MVLSLWMGLCLMPCKDMSPRSNRQCCYKEWERPSKLSQQTAAMGETVMLIKVERSLIPVHCVVLTL